MSHWKNTLSTLHVVMKWVKCSGAAFAYRDGQRRNTIEVASVCPCVSSPYSFHRKVTVATLSTMTVRATRAK